MNVEILAPVGDFEMLKSAIYSGADAVYLGSKFFNARMKADNFDEFSLDKSVKFAHLFGVKVYLTLNTLVTDLEMQDVIKEVQNALSAGVDAFIIQDLGIAYVLKNMFPEIVLHASTQMGIHNLEGAKVCEKMGFERVVLSRETTLEDIRNIKKNTNLEIEYFVHGALCVAFSGNCYLSSYLKNKSGNRGECLQLCRLCYESYKDDNFIDKGYLISPRDLCYIDKIKELIDAGVISFKIEGRLKRPAYVSATVEAFRNALGRPCKNKLTKQDLKRVFARGEFNSGEYLEDNNDGIINKKIQNHQGIKIGSVVGVEKFKDLHKITIKSTHEISKGDGLKFIGKDVKENSLGVGNVEIKNGNYIVFSKCFPKKNDDVYLILDFKFEDNLLKNIKKIKINAKFIAKIDKKTKLLVNYQNITKEIEGDFVCEKAKSQGITKENVLKNLSKTQDTFFEFDEIEVDLEDGLFMPLVEINNLRRKALEEIEREILQKMAPKNLDLEQKEFPEMNISSYKKLALINENSKILDSEAYIIDVEIYSVENVNRQIERIKEVNEEAEIYLNLPIIANYKDMEILKDILKNKQLGVVVNNLYGLEFLDGRNVIISQGMNVSNKYTVLMLNSLGVFGMFYKTTEDFAKYSCEMLRVYPFNFPLMTFKHCPFKVNYNSDCKNCKCHKNLIYKNDSGNEFVVRRHKIHNCYFGLYLK